MRGKEMLISAIMFGGLSGYAWWSLPPGVVDAADQRARIERRADFANCPGARPAETGLARCDRARNRELRSAD